MRPRKTTGTIITEFISEEQLQKIKEYTAKHTILATGARSRELPNLPQDGKKIIGYRQAMNLPTQPKSLVVVGSGAIGVEFAYFYNTIGTKVTIVEFMDRIVPVEDEEVSKQLEKSLKKSGIDILTKSEVTSVELSRSSFKNNSSSNNSGASNRTLIALLLCCSNSCWKCFLTSWGL
jgi:pyruvate/2-oxoglutarate dehydrogenase complex dihydrolipoamide dehydrogenase (E3) component